MNAIVFTKYGSPDVLELIETDKPTPKEDEVLVKVHAASANPIDWHRMRGTPFLVRLGEGVSNPKNPRIGVDLAGRVEMVGSNITQFKPGDEVFGLGTGSFAEFVSVQASNLALKPTNISFDVAAAVPIAALTALQGLRDAGQIQAGQRVLVNGASGGVGTFAVQIAKSYGAEVIGVCSTRNLDMVHSIGADHVIDYTKEDFTKSEQHYDLIFDVVGNRSTFDYQRALNPNGICVMAGFTSMTRLIGQMVTGSLISKLGDKKITGMGMAKPNQKDLQIIKELLETNKITAVIDRHYPLAETPDAIGYLETKHARGKVIINVLG